jgi:hypothetical protein
VLINASCQKLCSNITSHHYCHHQKRGLNWKFEEAIKIIQKWQWIFSFRRGIRNERKSADKLWWKRNWINYSDMLHHQSSSSKCNGADPIIKSLNGNSWNSSMKMEKLIFRKSVINSDPFLLSLSHSLYLSRSVLKWKMC